MAAFCKNLKIFEGKGVAIEVSGSILSRPDSKLYRIQCLVLQVLPEFIHINEYFPVTWPMPLQGKQIWKLVHLILSFEQKDIVS